MGKQTIEELEAQVKQLAAENAALKQVAMDYADLADSRLSEMTANCESDCRRECYEFTNKLPATDAAIASLHAEGVEMYAQHLKDKYEGIEYSLIGEYYTDGEEDRVSDQGEIDCALAFAAQLRSKSEVQS